MDSLLNTEDYDIAISKACLSGDIEELKKLIENGADVNVRDRSRYITRFKGFSVPVLFNAVEKQHVQVVRLLLHHGGTVHNLDKFGRSALHVACSVGNIEIVQVLLDYGANVNHRNSNGKCPIHVASTCGYSEIVKLLLDYDCVVNVNDLQGSTPLYCAVENGHENVVDVLLNYGAVIHMDMETFNNSPLQIGCENFHHLAVKRLLLQHDKLMEEEIGEIVSKIHLASLLNDIDSVLDLLNSGCDINSQDARGRTLLHIACKMGYLDLVQLCLSKDIDVDLVDNEGMTALYYACEGRCKSFFRIQHVDDMLSGDSVCTNDTNGPNQNLLNYELFTKIASILLENGAHVDGAVADEEHYVGWTPLCHACYSGNLSLLQLLIANGADVNRGTERFPLLTAISSRHPDVVKFLIENKANINMFGSNFDRSFSSLHLAVHFGLDDVTSLLLDAGADPNLKEGNTSSCPLSLIQRKSVEICTLLLNKAANPNIANKFGDTPIHDACRLMWEDEALVRTLLDGGGHVNVLNHHGRTPLHNACEKGHPKIVMTLLLAGADTAISDTKGYLPLMTLLDNYLALGKLSSALVIDAMMPLLNASCPWYLWVNRNNGLLGRLHAHCRQFMKILIPFGFGSPVQITPHIDILMTLCAKKDYELLSMMIECGYRIPKTDIVDFFDDIPSNKEIIKSFHELFRNDCKTLKFLCCLTIRRTIYSSLSKGKLLNLQIESLPIPGRLKQDLMFKYGVPG